MGFFKSFFDVAGKKTGSAFGNWLFPNYTDYVRIGDLGKGQEERLWEEHRLQQRRLETNHQIVLQEALLEIRFDSTDIEHNISELSRISAILDSLPAYIDRSDMEQKTYKMAKSLMQSGITICKRIDPNNKTVKEIETKNKPFSFW